MILTLLAAFLTGLFIYWGDKRDNFPVPFEISIMQYLQTGERWHSYGHYLFEFALTHFFFSFMLTYFPAVLLYFSTAIVLFFVFLMLPSLILTLGVELIADKHYKDFWKNFDFFFDVVTHMMGSLTAVLMILKL